MARHAVASHTCYTILLYLYNIVSDVVSDVVRWRVTQWQVTHMLHYIVSYLYNIVSEVPLAETKVFEEVVLVIIKQKVAQTD
jgi:hypothetical protein